ncbi:MAG TPA: hypothetical protein VFE53_03890 [Mucilaginibacter sp.]|jgi:uncharacterized protein YegP (UPF0339 family)|nr:hypothetical protein [Mucilaginibacter sp.]
MKLFKYTKGKRYFIVLICTAIYATALSQPIKIDLRTDTLKDPPGKFIGISNLFFDKVDSSGNFSFPSGWKNIEQAQMIENLSLEPVSIFRIKDDSGKFSYYVDSDNGKKIAETDLLVFRQSQSNKIAAIKVRTKNLLTGKFTRYVPYEVIISGKYIYGRIKEQKTGVLNVDNNSYKIVVRPYSRSSVNYSLKESSIFIDFNRDGEIHERWSVYQGKPVSGEAVSYEEPFKIGTKGFIVDSLEENGSWLTIRPYNSQEALAVGYKMPSIDFYDINGELLNKASKKYMLIELWSTSCPFCESIRNRLNTLFSDKNSSVDWITISRENKQTVNDFLTTHPISAKIVIPKDNQWKYLNPQTVTPLFYLVANDGTVIFTGSGADMVNVLELLAK